MEDVASVLREFSYDRVSVPEHVWQCSGREVNQEYWDRLIQKIFFHMLRKYLLPIPLGEVFVLLKSFKYLWMGMKSLGRGKLEVSVLDAVAIAVYIVYLLTRNATRALSVLADTQYLDSCDQPAQYEKPAARLASCESLNADLQAK